MIRLEIFVLVLLAAVHWVAPQECKEDKIDQCGAVMTIFGNSAFKPIRKKGDLLYQCGEVKKAIECVNDYNEKCLQGNQKRIVRVLVQAANRTFVKTCDDENIYEVLNHAICIGDTHKIQRTCHKVLLEKMDSIERSQDLVQKDMARCCSYEAYLTCSVNPVKSLCGEKSADFLYSLIEGFAGDLYYLTCAGHKPDSKECMEAAVPPRESTAPLPRSVVPLLMDIFKS